MRRAGGTGASAWHKPAAPGLDQRATGEACRAMPCGALQSSLRRASPHPRPHQAVGAADGHCGLGAVLGQRVQARAGAATQDHGCAAGGMGRGGRGGAVGVGARGSRQEGTGAPQLRGERAGDLGAAAAHPARCWSASGCCPRAGCGPPAWRRPARAGTCGRGCRCPAEAAAAGVSVQPAAAAGWTPRHPPDCPHFLVRAAERRARGVGRAWRAGGRANP